MSTYCLSATIRVTTLHLELTSSDVLYDHWARHLSWFVISGISQDFCEPLLQAMVRSYRLGSSGRLKIFRSHWQNQSDDLWAVVRCKVRLVSVIGVSDSTTSTHVSCGDCSTSIGTNAQLAHCIDFKRSLPSKITLSALNDLILHSSLLSRRPSCSPSSGAFTNSSSIL